MHLFRFSLPTINGMYIYPIMVFLCAVHICQVKWLICMQHNFVRLVKRTVCLLQVQFPVSDTEFQICTHAHATVSD